MPAILIEISFFEALFKQHYTKGFRLSYPIPLPTSVAGIFGALLGIDREEIKERFKDFYFGAKLLNLPRENYENATFIQIGKKFKNWPPGVALTQILQEPIYRIAIANKNEKEINEIFQNLSAGFKFLPYGGQNDYFVKDIKILGIKNISESNIIENYAPKDWVEKIEIREEDSFLTILPVMHKISNEPFYFAYKTNIYLKNPILVVDNIALYELSRFYYST